jgi:hypothetical protein
VANSFGFKSQLEIGQMGVSIAKSIIRSKYPNIKDFNDDMEMQRRGIDLWVEGLGYVEIKSDSHSSDKLFFELTVMGKPGAVDRCCADYYIVLYYKEHLMLIIKRADLQQWLREHWSWIRTKNPTWVKTISSTQNGKYWNSVGITVPREDFERDVKVITLTWQDSDEVCHGIEWKGEN